MEGSGISRLHPCVAHRGWSGGAPENTLAAFKLALSEPAVGWIELDVHLSRDEIPVVIHDSTLNRTTNARGKVRERTAAELAQLDAGGWFHPVYAGEPVPRLEQVLELTAGRCRLNIELKDGAPDKSLLAQRVVELLRKHGRVRNSVLTSFDPDLILAAKHHVPNVPTGLIVDKRDPHLVSKLVELQATTLSIHFNLLTESLLLETQSAGIEVMTWTVNNPRDLNRLVSLRQPFQICTNYPDRWLAAVKEGE